ncbi:MAG: TatD family hydrolase [Actinomycetota bacterium]
MWFDSHCHLHLCATDSAVADIVARARAAGVEDVVTIGIDFESSRISAALASEYPIWAAVGVHPNEASDWEDDAAREIEELLGSDRVVAVGETGLDFYRDRAPRDVQTAAFKDHISLAKRHDKALIIHTRDSVGAAVDVLEQENPPERVVFHCWSGDADELRRALALGAFISFAGNVSFKGADNLRAFAEAVPDDRLLIETDAPFLTPVPHRGTSNEPSYVPLVGAAVAAARSVTAEAVAKRTGANARTLFGLAPRH